MIMPDRTDNDLKNRQVIATNASLPFTNPRPLGRDLNKHHVYIPASKCRWNSIIRKPLHPSGRPWNQSEIEHRDAVFAKPKQSRRRPEPLTQVKRPRMLKVAPSTENSSYYPTVTISLRGEPVWWSDAVRSGELKWDPRAGIRSGQLKYDSQDSQEVLLPEELKYDLQNSIQSEELKDAAPLSVCIDGNQPGHPVLLPLVELQHELPVPIRAREPEREPLDALHSADFNYSVLDKAIRPSAEACVVPSRSDEVDIDTFNIGVDSSGLPDIEVEADADKVFADLLTDEELDSEDDDMSLEFALRTPQAQQPSSARDATRSAQKYSPQSMLMLRSLCGITPHEPIDAALEYSVAEDLREYADMNGVIEIEVEYDERTEHSTNSHQVLHSGVQLGRIALPHVSFATDP